MANRWRNNGNHDRLFFWAPNHCRWWLQPWNEKMLARWKKSYDKSRQYIKKQRHHFTNKVRILKATVFPVVMYVWESWTIKKAEDERTDGFKLWCCGACLPWTERRSNQSILKEINPEFSLEGLMLKLQSFGHLMWRADSLEKTLILRKTESRRIKSWQKMSWLDSITDSMDLNLNNLREIRDGRGNWSASIHGVANSRTWFSDWITATTYQGNQTAKNAVQ